MEKDKKYINDNIQYYFKDIISKYNIKLVQLNELTTAFIVGSFAFEIEIDRHYDKANLSYIYKEMETNDYNIINCHTYLQKEYEELEKKSNTSKGRVKVENKQFNEFIKGAPMLINIVNSLIDINTLLSLYINVIINHNSEWLNKYIKDNPGNNIKTLVNDKATIISSYF